MKKVITTTISIIGILIVCIFAFIFYLTNIGPSLVGPKNQVDAICQALEPSMTIAEIGESRIITLDDLGIDSHAGPDMTLMGKFDEQGNPINDAKSNRLQVDIEAKSGFICICQVDVENGVATAEGEVFCSS